MMMLSEAGFQRNTGGIQLSTEGADDGREGTAGGCHVTAKGRDGRVSGMLSLITSTLLVCLLC